MDGRTRDLGRAKCAKTGRFGLEKRKRRGFGPASGGRHPRWAMPRPEGFRQGSGTSFEHDPPEITDHRSLRDPPPARCRPDPGMGDARATRGVPRTRGKAVPTPSPRNGVKGMPRVRKRGRRRAPGTAYIRSIIALPKPEQETCVAPCISRAKS